MKALYIIVLVLIFCALLYSILSNSIKIIKHIKANKNKNKGGTDEFNSN